MRLWDVATGAQRAEFAGRAGDAKAVAISPDATWLAAAGRDGTVRIWDVRDNTCVAMMRVEQDLTTCVWSQQGHGLIVGGSGGLYRFEFSGH
ncbi:hypothetical protein AB0H83_51060 [Dactylosporangium sp. NPDC050688]|uniref:WD40 repeat domain-containing protein n=1 Tax=Dactylosporangium sp. NPDC050688 TaxID=3157217 RepID=UPI003405784A